MSKQTDLDDFMTSLGSVPDGHGGKTPSDTMIFQAVVVAPGDSVTLSVTLAKDLISPVLFVSSTQASSSIAIAQIKHESTVLFAGETLDLETLKKGKDTGITTSKNTKLKIDFTNNNTFETIVGLCLSTTVPVSALVAKIKSKK